MLNRNGDVKKTTTDKTYLQMHSLSLQRTQSWTVWFNARDKRYHTKCNSDTRLAFGEWIERKWDSIQLHSTQLLIFIMEKFTTYFLVFRIQSNCSNLKFISTDQCCYQLGLESFSPNPFHKENLHHSSKTKTNQVIVHNVSICFNFLYSIFARIEYHHK